MKRQARVAAIMIGLVCAALGCGSPAIELLARASKASDGGTESGFDAAGRIADDGAAPDAMASELPSIPGLLGLRIEPATLTITDDGVVPSETTSVKAYGLFADGERDVTSEVSWSLDDTSLGTVEAGTVTSAGVGGKTDLVARAQGVTAGASITFLLDITITAKGTPAIVENRFADATGKDVVGDTGTLQLVYPSHETMLPLNLPSPLHQWRTNGTLADLTVNAFQVRLDSEFTHVRIYTNRTSVALSPQLWQKLALAHAGKSLSIVVRGTTLLPASPIYATNPITVYFAKSEVRGALYYWSTGAQGIMRATLNAPIATKFFPGPGAPSVTCASCHTISRDGRRMALGYDGELLRQISIPDRTLQIPSTPNGKAPEYGWGTFNPDGTRLLYANKGKLTLLDATSGKKLLDVALPKDVLANFPDWSPDGKWVVVAIGGGKFGNKEVAGTSLARMQVLANKFGTPQTILKSAAPDDTLFFPTFAPDGETIAFVRAKGKSKDNPTAQIYVMRADGTGTPQLLTRLNQRVGASDGITSAGNTMPTWAPSSTDDTYWLAFSSVRDYGNVLLGRGLDQLWGAAIDRAKIGSADDPSFPAFWMPFQQSDESNHRALWTVDPGDQACSNNRELCDELDNNCNGIPDEDCCMPSQEVCGNNLDEDCDGTPDDGCNCSQTENCTNGSDDDCDGLIDAADEDCIPLQ